ncbi:prenyltransferase [Gracilibacillus sp. D59]|uniref:prenyltransferase n=1 Tax=Gracilibacillus sp. D59 TaxID=3457434 RepID=UPI003FCDEB35
MDKYIDLFGYRHLNQPYAFKGSWWKIIRPPTLTGSIMPMIYGTLIAVSGQWQSIRYDHFVLFLFIGVMVQMAVNMLNDYFDFLKGQEEGKWSEASRSKIGITPYLQQVPFVFIVLVVLFSILTLWLAIKTSMMIITIGIAGLVLGYFYSAGRSSLSTLGLGEMAAAFSLGWFPIMIASYIQTGHVTGDTLLLALPFCLLIASMILTNNTRDIEKDHSTRNTIAIRIGHQKAYWLLFCIVIAAYISVFVLMFFGLLPLTASIVVLAFPTAVSLFRHMHPESDTIKKGMLQAAIHHFIFSSLLIMCLIV